MGWWVVKWVAVGWVVVGWWWVGGGWWVVGGGGRLVGGRWWLSGGAWWVVVGARCSQCVCRSRALLYSTAKLPAFLFSFSAQHLPLPSPTLFGPKAKEQPGLKIHRPDALRDRRHHPVQGLVLPRGPEQRAALAKCPEEDRRAGVC